MLILPFCGGEMKLIILRSDLQILKQSFSSFSRESLIKFITNLKIARAPLGRLWLFEKMGLHFEVAYVSELLFPVLTERSVASYTRQRFWKKKEVSEIS